MKILIHSVLVDSEENLIACIIEAAAFTGRNLTFLSPHDNPSFIIVSFVLR
jgi:hypothetical protein